MDYRDHFPGTFDQYLDLLEETIYKQQIWAKDYERLYIGFAVNFLFKEERDGPYPEEKFQRVVERIASTGSKGLVVFCEEQIRRYGMWEVAKKILG
jgi:hypothetical protein